MFIKFIRFLIVLSVSIVFFGCSAQSVEPEIDFKPPKYVQEMPSKEDDDNANLGSLYGSGDNPFFSDRKAMHINDIVTVLITESASATSSGKKSLKRTNEAALSPGVVTYGGNSQPVQTQVNNVNDLTKIGFGYKTDTAFSGSGTNSRTERFTTTVSARVVKVMANGNYFIIGSREILVNGEKQIIQLSGVIRPYDIGQNNRISSSLISDAKILYKTEGDIDRNTNQGWLSKIAEAVWPF